MSDAKQTTTQMTGKGEAMVTVGMLKTSKFMNVDAWYLLTV
jgi:hypothetical protein